jgi:hypothetical protein
MAPQAPAAPPALSSPPSPRQVHAVCAPEALPQRARQLRQAPRHPQQQARPAHRGRREGRPKRAPGPAAHPGLPPSRGHTRGPSPPATRRAHAAALAQPWPPPLTPTPHSPSHPLKHTPTRSQLADIYYNLPAPTEGQGFPLAGCTIGWVPGKGIGAQVARLPGLNMGWSGKCFSFNYNATTGTPTSLLNEFSPQVGRAAGEALPWAQHPPLPGRPASAGVAARLCKSPSPHHPRRRRRPLPSSKTSKFRSARAPRASSRARPTSTGRRRRSTPAPRALCGSLTTKRRARSGTPT